MFSEASPVSLTDITNNVVKTKAYCQASLLQTWTARCLMKFYASVAASVISPKGNETVERIEKRVLDSNPVMEAFGKLIAKINSKNSGHCGNLLC